MTTGHVRFDLREYGRVPEGCRVRVMFQVGFNGGLRHNELLSNDAGSIQSYTLMKTFQKRGKKLGEIKTSL